MKKIFGVVLIAALVLGMAGVAMAAHLEVTGNGAGVRLTGEFRVRGINTNNATDADADVDDRQAWIDQRYRLMLDALVGDDVEVKTRFTAASGMWDGTASTGTWAVDHAYLVLKAFDSTFYIGRQPASWGNKLLVWGAIKDRFKVVRKAGDITYGGFYQKDREDLAPTGGNDQDEFAAFIIIPAGDHKVSLLYVMVKDRAGTGTGTDDSTDGALMDVSYKGKVGPASLMAEFATKTGDLFETAVDENAPTAFFIAAGMDLSDAIALSIAYASAANTYVADGDFAPTLAFGTDVNPTAIQNFGDSYNASVEDDTVSAVVVGAKYKASDALTAGLNVASATLSDDAEVTATEVDVYATYNLATNTTLWLGYMHLMTTDMSANDDPITSAAWQIKTMF